MSFRHVVSLALAASLTGTAGLGAQEPVAAPQAADTGVRGYAPADPAAAAPPAAPATTAAAPGRGAIGAQLGFVDVLPSRSMDRIASNTEAVRTLDLEADADLAAAQSDISRTKGLIAEKKQEISSIDSKRKVAEKNKQEGEKVAYEAEKKDAERHKQFLERRLSLRESEVDRAKAAKKLTQSALLALDLERQLATRRQERASVAATDPAATRRHDTVIRELEGRVLEAQRSRSQAAKQVADKDIDIAQRRMELHKAQVAAAGQ